METIVIIFGILTLVLLWDIYKQLTYVNENIEKLHDKLEGKDLDTYS